jgi:predicted KAP-like P-loop ATPase
MPRNEGHVLALYGRRGFGKTTILNYVRHYLNGTGPDQRPIVVSFNPWWFSGQEDLVRAFFSQLSANIEDIIRASAILSRNDGGVRAAVSRNRVRDSR